MPQAHRLTSQTAALDPVVGIAVNIYLALTWTRLCVHGHDSHTVSNILDLYVYVQNAYFHNKSQNESLRKFIKICNVS